MKSMRCPSRGLLALPIRTSSRPFVFTGTLRQSCTTIIPRAVNPENINGDKQARQVSGLVGSDLGTANSAVEGTGGGKPIIVNQGGGLTTPPVAAIRDNGAVHRGKQAKQKPKRQDKWPGHRSSSGSKGNYVPDPSKTRAIGINKCMKRAKQAEEILHIIKNDFDGFDNVNLATAVHLLASIEGASNMHEQITQSPEFYRLINAIKDRAEKLDMRCLANIIWGCATMAYLPPCDVTQKLCAELVAKAESSVAQDVANTLWALSSLQYHPGDEVLAALAASVKPKISDFTSQHISNTVLSFAKFGYAIDPVILEALGREAHAKIRDFNAQDVANTLWGLSKLGIADGELFSAVGAAARAKMQHFNSQGLANSVWAYGNLGISPGDDVLEKFAACAAHKINEFTPQNLSNFVWSFAKLQFYEGPFMDTAADEAASRMEEFTGQGLSYLVWGYAKLSHYHSDLLDSIVDAATDQAEELEYQHISQILYAAAVLNWPATRRASILVQELVRRFNSQTEERLLPHQYAVLLWSTAVADVVDRPFWDACLGKLKSSEVTYSELSDIDTSQIFQAHMLVTARHPDIEWPMDQELLERGRETWKAAVLDIKISEFHSEVSRMLRSMGVDHSLKYLTEDGLLTVDIALPSEKIAIEINGPYHFTRNTRRPMGDMLSRTALMEARGWKVASVPFFSWYRDDDARRAFLQNLLEKARAGLSVHPTKDNDTTRLDVPQALVVEPVQEGGSAGGGDGGPPRLRPKPLRPSPKPLAPPNPPR